MIYEDDSLTVAYLTEKSNNSNLLSNGQSAVLSGSLHLPGAMLCM